jgi:hypothetical protein
MGVERIEMVRTFVIADAHGHPEVIRAALEHGGFEPDRDRLVFGGDFVDRGSDPQGCLDLIERYATEVLIGNHDLGVLLDVPVWPQEPESPRYRPLLIDKVLHKDPVHSWKAVTAVEGVLVSHAGISERYERVFRETCHGEPALFAEHLNKEFREAVRRRVDGGHEYGAAGPAHCSTAGAAHGGDPGRDPPGDWGTGDDRGTGDYQGTGTGWDTLDDPSGLFSECGPFWFRPPPYSNAQSLGGMPQIAGHSPPIEELAEDGFYMIDPTVWLEELGEPLRFRYAVIQGGRVQVEQGMVGGPGTRPGLSPWC